MTDRIDQLFDDLQSRGYAKDKTNQQFRDFMLAPGKQGYENRKQFFEDFKSQGMTDLETYEDFASLLGLHAGTPERRSTPTYQPTANEMAGFQSTINSAGRTAANPTQSYERKAGLMEKRQGLNVPQRVNLGESNNLTPTEQHLNPETGELEQGYMTESGNEYDNKAIADMEQRELDRQRWEREHPEESLMGQIDNRIANLEEEIRKREDIEGIPTGFGTTLYQSGLGAPYRPDAQQQSYDDMRMALRDLQDAKTMLERNKQLHASSDFLGGVGIPFTKDWFNNWKNFGYGVWDALHDVSMYDFGVSEMSKAGTYMRIKNKMERGEELTDQETDIALAGMALAQAQQLADLPHGYTAGVTTTEMVPFMAQMAANPASGVGKAFARKAVRKFGRDGLKAVTARVAARVAGNIGEAAVLSNTWQAGKTAADIAQRNTGGQFAYDEDGNVIMGHYERGDNGEENFVEGGKGIGQSIWEGEAASIIENFTELGFGGSINGMLSKVAGSKLGKKIGLSYISDLVGKVGSTPFARNLKRFMERTHWDGMIEEPLEEEYGIILNSLLTGDNQFSDLIDSKQQADIFAGTMWFGGMMAAMNTAAYPFAKRAMKRNLNNADVQGEMAFHDEWPTMKAAIDNMDDKQIVDLLYGIKDDDKFNNEQKAAMFGYAARLKQYQGANVADMLMRMEDNLGQNEASIKGAYDEGTEAQTPDEMKEFVDEATAAGENLTQYGKEFTAMIANGSANPGKTLDYLMNNRDIYDDEQIAAAADYYQKQARAQGVMDAALDKVDLEVEKANAEVVSNTHKATGNVIMAKGDGDMDYYIIAGDPDIGTGGAVVVKNAATGELSVKSPEELMIYSMKNAEELIQQNETVLRPQLEQQADDDITYGSPANEVFDLEDTVTLQDGNGGVIEGQIVSLPNAVDGVFVVQTNDGRALQMTADDMNRRIVRHNGAEVVRAAATPQQSEQTAGEPAGTVDTTAAGTVATEEEQSGNLDNAGGEAGAENGTGADNPPATALSRIPVRTDAKGNPLKGKSGRPILDWHKASVEDAAAALVETTGGDMVMARDTASDLVKNEQARLEKIRKQKPKGDDPIEIAESRVAIRQQEQEQQAVIKQWQDVNQLIQRQMREEQQRVEAEREAAKSEEQRQREAEEARIRKEKQDEIERQRIREQIEKDRERRTKEYEPVVKAREEMAGDAEALSVLNDTEPRSLEEWVSSLLNPHSMLWQDASESERGLQSELGLKRADMQRFIQLLGTKESGAKPFGKVVLDIYESLPEGIKNQTTDEDVRRVVLDMFRSMENSTQMMHLTEQNRIDEAREMLRENLRREQEAEMDAWAESYHLTPEERDTFDEWLQVPPTDIEADVINQIIADNEQNRTSPSVGGEPVSGTDAAGVEGGESQVQQEGETAGNGVYEETVAEGTEADSGEPAAADHDVAGRAPGLKREYIRELLSQIGADVALADRMSDYEVEQLNAMTEDWEAYNDDFGVVIEQQKDALKSKDKKVRDAAVEIVNAAQNKANDAFIPIEEYIDGLNTKYGIESEEPYEGAIPTPSVDEPRYNAIRQALVEAYKNGDKAAIHTAVQAIQQYVDEGLDAGEDHTDVFDIAEVYDGDDPEKLADQFIIRTFWDRYLDDDEDQEYIKTGLKPEMRGEAAVTQQQTEPSQELGKTSTPEEIAEEEAKVDTNPTEGQKEAGNYQKGHINVDGYDITIENPKGSVRSGFDKATNTTWEQEMHNTYGYIRGTEGVDGDHIDVFLSDSPTDGNVFVIDQVDKNGEFNEHKVMYGFGSEEEARQAYLSNYEEGWQGLGAITEVSREEFKKWVESSHRKTKPFAEYKSVKKTGGKPAGTESKKGNKEHKRIVSDDQMEELRKKLLEKFNNLNAGIDVERMLLGAMYAVGKIERGVTKFADYATEMVNDIGDAIRPYLKAFYEAVRNMPEAAEYRDQMDSAEYVAAFDEYNFDKQKAPDAITKAEQVVRRQKAKQQVKKVEKEVKQKIAQGDLFAGDLFGEVAVAQQQTEQRKPAGEPAGTVAKPKTAWWSDENRPKGLNPKDYKTYMTDEAKQYFASHPMFDGWKRKDLAFVTAAVWDGVVIPYEALKDLPEIVEAEQVVKNATANGVLQISEEERDQYAQRLLDSEHGSAVFENGKIKKVNGVEDFSGPVRQERKALVIIGYPAAGKSSVFANRLSNEHGARIIDSDTAKPWLEGFNGGNGAGYVQNASSEVAERAIDIAVGKGDNIILPRIGGGSVFMLSAALKLAGYDVQLYFNDVATVTSVDRATSRFAESGRYLSLQYLTSKDGVPSKNFSIFAEENIGDYINELSEGKVQELRRRLGRLLESETVDGKRLWQSSTADKGGYRTLDEFLSVLLESGGTGVTSGLNHLESPIFSYAEWKSNDVAFGEKPKEIWNSKSGKPMPRKENQDGKRKQGLPGEPSSGGEGERQESRGADSGRRGVGSEQDRSERPGSVYSVDTVVVPEEGEETRDFSGGPARRAGDNARVSTSTFHKNKRNNHGERGVDYAPTSPKARFNANVEAIRLMRQLIENGVENPTQEEKEVLRKYSGWGGLGTYFNDEDSAENKILRDLLDEDEYKTATLSIKTAYFTPAYVVDSMWDIAKEMGFKGGTVLEGSAGIGNIIGQMPSEIGRRSDIEAVEIDKISGNILRLLYPDAKVHIQGFQETVIPNGSVDLAITNVPFAAYLYVIDKVDKDLSRRFRTLHDFCIAKNIRKLREGGIGIFISTSGTLDKSNDLRAWITDEGQADVVGAFRLNNETFGGTNATSDIIVVRKRFSGRDTTTYPTIDVSKASPMRVGTYEDKFGEEHQVTMTVNDYFKEHPEMMAGEMAFGYEKGVTYRPGSYGLYPVKSKNQEQMLSDFAKSMSKAKGVAVTQQQTGQKPVENQLTMVKEGRMLIDDNGRLCVSRYGTAWPLELNSNKVKGYSKEQCFKDYQDVQKAVDDVLQQQLSSPDDEALKPKLDALNKAYDKFVKRYGYLHKNTAISFLRNDIDFPTFLELEKYSETKDMSGKVTVITKKAPLFTERVLGFKMEPQPKTVKDALIASIFRTNGIDLPWITQKLNEAGVAAQSQHAGEWTEEDVKKGILVSRLGFEDPSTGQLVVRHVYLSGNVREKLAIAEAYNRTAGEPADTGTAGRYAANIEELRKVVPMDIPAHLIDFTLGSSWIPNELYIDYLRSEFGLPENIRLTHLQGTWVLDVNKWSASNETNKAKGVYSQKFRTNILGSELALAALNNRTMKVSRQETSGYGSSKTTRTVVDQEATSACNVKIDEIKDGFKQYIRKRVQDDQELARRIEKIYNDKFNALVPLRIDDEMLPDRFEDANMNIHLYDHQKRGVLRGVTSPTMLAHEVGTGKSFTLISTAMEMRRLGTAKKPMLVVQNATVAQMTADAKLLYPNAKVLSLSEKDRDAEGRRAFYAKIRFNDWDLIIIPQSTLDMIPDSPERELQFIQEQIDEKKHIIELAQAAKMDSREIDKLKRELEKKEQEYGDKYLDSDPANGGSRRKTGSKKDAKREAASLDKAETKAQEKLDRVTDDVQFFDDLGVDAILVDEAHGYKHLGFETTLGRSVKGVDPSYSKKCAGLYNKTRAVFEKAGWKNVVFATGTPISNTAAEIWTFMKYLMPADVMKQNDIYYFDDFVHNFGSINQMLEFKTNGKFNEVTRFAAYVNRPELMRIWMQVADIVRTEEVGEVKSKVPEKEDGKDQDVFLPQSPSLVSIMSAVRAELERFEQMDGAQKRENSHIPLTMYGIAKRAAIDPRLVNADAPDEPTSKTNAAVKEIVKDLKATEKYKGTVAVFCDNQNRLGSGGTIDFNIFDDMKEKLLAQGVPEAQIAVIKSSMSITAKQKIFDKVNTGDVRVILGSTQTLGTGVNIQERLHLLIHMDAPDRPMDYTQRNGRIERQGNLHREWGLPIRILRFGVEDSLDVTAYQRLKTKSGFIDSIMNGKSALVNNQTDRTIEEEEEGLFDNPVAVLSGSQFALKKNQAERELRKMQGKYNAWEADQIYVTSKIRQNESWIKSRQAAVAQNERELAHMRELFPEGKVKVVSVDGVKVDISSGETAAYGELGKVIKEKINDPVNATVKKLRENQIYNDETQHYTIELDGHAVNFEVNISRGSEYDSNTGKMRTVVHKTTAYRSPDLRIEDGTELSSSKSVLEHLTNILEQYVSGAAYTDAIEAAKSSIERTEAETSQLKEREGQPFQYGKELEEAKKRVAEYTELMKQEMKEKEAKYAEQAKTAEESAGTEAFDLKKAEENDVDADVLYSADEDDDPIYSRSFKDYFGDWESDPENTSKVVDENGRPLILYHGTNLTQVNRSEPFYEFYPDSHFGTIGQARTFVDKQKLRMDMNMQLGIPLRRELTKIYPVYLNIRNPKRVSDTPADEDEWDGTQSEWWEKQVARAKAQGYDGIVYLNEYEDPEHPADSWIAFYPEQVKSAEENIGTYDSKDPDIRHREMDRFAEGQTFPIRTVYSNDSRNVLGGKLTYITSLMPDEYRSIDQLLDAVRTQYPEYYATVEDGMVVMRSYQQVLRSSGNATAQRTKKEVKGKESYIARKTRNAINAVNYLAQRMGLDVEVLTDTEGLTGKKARSKGWFNPKTGKITIVLPNHANQSDVINTLLHEGVAHYGLRKMFGQNFDTFLDNVYDNVSPEIKAIIDASIKRNGWSRHEATEEYLARLAERTDFEAADRQGWWLKIKNFFLNMLSKAGFDTTLTDNELRYILWRSYDNLLHPGYRRNVFDRAREVDMQRKLGVERTVRGKVAVAQQQTERAAEAQVVSLNPLVQRQRELKAKYPDALFLFKMPDGSYKAVGDDVESVGNAFGRGAWGNNSDSEYNVPDVKLDLLLPRLVRMGYRIGILDAPQEGVAREEGDEDVRFVDDEPNDIEEVNRTFNEQLQQQIDGTLPKGHVYEMGMPSKYLQSTGVPNLPIRLQASVLNRKSNDPLHRYSLEEVKDLVKLIQKPIAIFNYGDKGKAQNLMVGIAQDTEEGKQFLVGLSLNPSVNGRELEINSVRNVFPKNFHDWIHWINQGKMLRVDDKKQIEDIIDALRINPVDYISDNDLNSAAKIVNSFENPKLLEENISEEEENELFSIRTKEPPKKTGIGYKVFVLKDGQLYPPMVANPGGEGTPVGVWLDADAAPIAGTSKTGRPQVKAGGKGTQGGSGQLAYRPGWHLGTIPYALQFNRKDENGERTLFPNNFVWAEVEYADDVDYQDEARQEGVNANGKYQHSLAGLKHVPTDGSYKYRTNPDPRTDEWVITGAMRVNRILKREEVDELVRKAGREPQKVQPAEKPAGTVATEEAIDKLNKEIEAMKAADEMGLLYRDDNDLGSDVAQRMYEQAVASESMKWKESWQDSMASLQAIQNAIAAETGKVATGAEDAYRFENRMHGRAKNMTEQYDYRYYRPMLKAFSDFIKERELTQEQGMEYLVAKSGLERNVYYAFRDAAKAMIIDEVKEERDRLEKDYAKSRISEADYVAAKADLDERERTGVDEFMQKVREMYAYQHAKEEYDAGNISYSEYLRIIETVIRGQLKRKKPKEDADGNIVSDNYYDDYAKDYSGLTETFAKELYDSAQYVKKQAQRTIDPARRRELWAEYNESMRQAYITARQMAEDAVFAGEPDAEPAGTAAKLWEKINAATKETLKQSYESGLIDRKNYYKVREMFNWYIPLRGWEEDKASDVYTYIGKENVFSPAVKKTWGRQSQAENPLAYIGNIAVSTILSGHRNQMKQHFLNYVLNNPTNLVSISESWYENIAPDGDSPVWVLRTADTAGKNPDEIAQIVNDFNEEMLQKQRDGRAMPVRGRLRLDVHATSGQKAEHVVEVQRAGRTYQLYINGNPKAAQALNGTAARAVSRISDTWLGKKITNLNRSMAMFFTSKNPAFVVSNLSRDLNMAGASVRITEGNAYNKKFVENVVKVLAPRMGESAKWVPASKQPTGLMPSLMRKWKKGTLDMNDETERYFKEFMDEGGETGFVNMLSVDSFKEKMQKEIAQMNGSSLMGALTKHHTGQVKETTVGKGLRLIGETFEFYNRCAEDATRFIVYMTSRQMGKTLEESIADAKDVTLNFNRKGTGGLGNAELRDLFIFVNPAIQALSNMYRMATGHPLKFGAVTAAFVAGGALMPIINQWMLQMWGNDDDKQAYWNLPPWIRKNNLVFWIPFTKNFVTIPLAQEFRVFYGVGEMMSSAIMDHPIDKLGLEVFSSVADLVPINPTGNGGNLMVDFAPTMVQPLMQVGENVDFTGKPIWKENQGNKYAPMYTKAYITTPKWMIKFSEAVNDVTGGNEGKKGVVENYAPFWGDYVNNPAVWNHLLQGYFGGMYNTIAKTFDVGVTAASGELPKIYQTPVINRFLNRPVERDNAGVLGDDYYSLTEARDALQYELNTWKKKVADSTAGEPAGTVAQEHVDEILNSPEWKRAEVVSHYEKIIKDLKAGEKAATESADKYDIKQSISLYKQQMLEELQAIDEGKEPLEAAVEAYGKARTFAEKNRLRMRIERLMMREGSGNAAAQRTRGRSADVEKALNYISDIEKESHDTNENYLEIATADNVRDDARIKAAKTKLKPINDEYKRMIADGRGSEASKFHQKHEKELSAWRTIDQLGRAMNANKKLLGKGNDQQILKMINSQRAQMIKAIEGVK